MEAEQRVNQRGLAGAVWTKQTNRAPAKFSYKILQDGPAAKSYAESVEIDYRSEVRGIANVERFLDRFS